VIRRLLVANRGEIAIRVLRACRDLDICGIAVFSDADRRSLHVRYADEAYNIGPPVAAESYLNIERIIDVAKQVKADAIHPGYGFLSENAEFAEACQRAGIIFVGPPPQAMRNLGDKIAARQLMRQAGVPVIPGTDEVHSVDEARAAAERIGFPLLIKAAAGGGGRGIRTVREQGELQRALELAVTESMAAFGQPAVYVEKLLSPVRHIEVQIMADALGNVVSLNERECSLQRRHQKVVEESPSPAVTDGLRRRMNDAAILAAKSAGYVNAGTVEFLLDEQGEFYFMEMNTRLQVEHPVTELVSGFDLVVDQLRVASGMEIGYGQDTVLPRGWAIECRIVAENPRQGFLPSVGRIGFVQEPAGPGVRVESALYNGFEVSPYYDALLAKLITWGRDRPEAIRRMRRALGEFKIAGVETNIPMHVQIMASPEFAQGRFDTEFLERVLDLGHPAVDAHGEQAALIAAAVLAFTSAGAGQRNGARRSGTTDGHPWRAARRRAALLDGGSARGWRSPA
jgi:acetyl-CoA carboxylase biotin carboxylase subunit